MAFGDSDWAGDRETRRTTTAVLKKLGNHCVESVSYSLTVIALSSGQAEFYALQRAAAGAWLCLHISTGWRRPVHASVRSDRSDQDFITSRSQGALASGACASSKACDQECRNRRQSCRRGNELHRGWQETRALVEHEWIEDEERLGAGNSESSAKVVLQGCANIV